MKILKCFFLALAIAALASRTLADEGLPVPSLQDFVESSGFGDPKLSPSGDFVAGVRFQKAKGYDIIVLSLVDGGYSAFHVGDYIVDWIEWANEDRLLISLRGFTDLKTGKQLTPWGIGQSEFSPLRFQDWWLRTATAMMQPLCLASCFRETFC